MMAAARPEKQELFFDFLGEYADFFAQMEEFEQHKLSILLSGNLNEIETTLSAAQANAKRLENLEQRRMLLQQEAGLSEMTLSQLADCTEGERSTQLHHQLRQLTSTLANIRFYNKKAMEVAEVNLRRYSRMEPRQEGGTHGTRLQSNA